MIGDRDARAAAARRASRCTRPMSHGSVRVAPSSQDLRRAPRPTRRSTATSVSPSASHCADGDGATPSATPCWRTAPSHSAHREQLAARVDRDAVAGRMHVEAAQVIAGAARTCARPACDATARRCRRARCGRSPGRTARCRRRIGRRCACRRFARGARSSRRDRVWRRRSQPSGLARIEVADAFGIATGSRCARRSTSGS